MNFFKLIDDEDAKCLYCQSNCDIESESFGYPVYYVNIYSCRQCQETFEHHWIEGLGEIVFLFTCNNLAVKFSQNWNKLLIADHDLLWKKRKGTNEIPSIPVFEIDFSNKEKLYEKLKTYLIFS